MTEETTCEWCEKGDVLSQDYPDQHIVGWEVDDEGVLPNEPIYAPCAKAQATSDTEVATEHSDTPRCELCEVGVRMSLAIEGYHVGDPAVCRPLKLCTATIPNGPAATPVPPSEPDECPYCKMHDVPAGGPIGGVHTLYAPCGPSAESMRATRLADAMVDAFWKDLLGALSQHSGGLDIEWDAAVGECLRTAAAFRARRRGF